MNFHCKAKNKKNLFTPKPVNPNDLIYKICCITMVLLYICGWNMSSYDCILLPLTILVLVLNAKSIHSQLHSKTGKV